MAESVTAPMVGKVLEVKCKVGDEVEEDQVILWLEAMKMEIPVVAPVAGIERRRRRLAAERRGPLMRTVSRRGGAYGGGGTGEADGNGLE